MKLLRDIAALAKTPVFGLTAEDDEGGGHDHEPTIISGTNKADEITAGGGPQEILGLNGADTVYAGGGPDVIRGQNGMDSLFAQGGPDMVFGGNGADYLHGGGGPDVLYGGNGDDILIGCMAADILTGGRGADTFVYRSASEAPAHGEDDDHGDDTGGHDGGTGGHDGGSGGHDGGEGGHDGCGGGDHDSAGQETITDFKPGTDHIDLSAIGTVMYLSTDPMENAAWLVQQGDDAMLYVDTDGSIEGDHPAEMGILLLGVESTAVTVDDFIF